MSPKPRNVKKLRLNKKQRLAQSVRAAQSFVQTYPRTPGGGLV